MVMLKYKGLNTLFVGGYALKAGYTEMKDEDFYKLMQTKTFKFRVMQKILEVPAGFSLEKPVKELDSSKELLEKAKDLDLSEEKEEQLSQKATLKLISQSKDADYLQLLIENDPRSKVVEEAIKKLHTLTE